MMHPGRRELYVMLSLLESASLIDGVCYGV